MSKQISPFPHPTGTGEERPSRLERQTVSIVWRHRCAWQLAPAEQCGGHRVAKNIGRVIKNLMEMGLDVMLRSLEFFFRQ